MSYYSRNVGKRTWDIAAIVNCISFTVLMLSACTLGATGGLYILYTTISVIVGS